MAATANTTLTLDQEQALGRKIQAGDDSAVNDLVEANLRFAMYMANRYRRESVDIDDLIQEANIGLMLAARHYDPERGVRFTSYAGWWIEAQLRRSPQPSHIRRPRWRDDPASRPSPTPG